MEAIVVSFPKSGRTWLRVMLDALGIACEYTHDTSSYEDALIFEEMRCCEPHYQNRVVIFIHRDPRDTVVSGFFQLTKRLARRRTYVGDLSDFVRDPRHGIEKIVRFNLAWLARLIHH